MAFWENIPAIGPLLGGVADIAENGTELVLKGAGELADGGTDLLLGPERKRRLATRIPKSLVDIFGDEDQIVNSARDIVKKAGFDSLSGLIGEVLRRAPELINAELLLTTLVRFARKALAAIVVKVAQLRIIQGGIFSNKINAATIAFIWQNSAEFGSFLVDLLECAKCYASATSLDGKDGLYSEHGQDNELDFSKPMNRHAVTCQVQRLVKSVIFMLKKAPVMTSFTDIDMTAETTLQSDGINDLGMILRVRPSGWQRVVYPSPSSWVRSPKSTMADSESQSTAGEPERRAKDKPMVINEKWLFVNGIATEPFWLHLACKKLARQYSREITGVYNRGDGILWDLIECAGERGANGEPDAAGQKRLIQRTRSSKEAQRSLKEQLQAALVQAKNHNTYVVMIAHSQGCLILRLVLEEIVTTDPGDRDGIRMTMWNRLCVFTFGNPSVDWKLELDPNCSIEPLDSTQNNLTYLSSHVRRTEHFANDKDFVAKLGVLSETKPENSGYVSENIFINKEKDWIGHLFGTQYSLDSDHYVDARGELSGKDSWMLNCKDGRSMKEMDSKLYRESVVKGAVTGGATDEIRALPETESIVIESIRSNIEANATQRDGIYSVNCDAEWQVLQYYKQQLDGSNDLHNVLTLTGCLKRAVAASCQDYVSKMWNSRGLQLLNAFAKGLGKGSFHLAFSPNHQVQIKFRNEEIETAHIQLSGTLDEVVATMAELAWLGAVFSCRGLEPDDLTMSHVLFDHAGRWGRFFSSSDIPFKLSISGEQIRNYVPRNDQGMCWVPLFRGGVLAYGFPVTKRVESDGLEIPFRLMKHLAKVSVSMNYKDRTIMVGASSLLFPVKYLKDAVQWHYVEAEDADDLVKVLNTTPNPLKACDMNSPASQQLFWVVGQTHWFILEPMTYFNRHLFPIPGFLRSKKADGGLGNPLA